MGKIEMEVVLKTDSAIDNAEDLQESIQDVGKETKKTSTDVSELGGTLDSVTGGAITKFKGMQGSLKGVVGSFKTLRGAIIATGIGALIIAITSLTQAFTASEEGQNRFAKILKQLGVIAGNIGDIFYSLGDTIYNVFTGNFDAAGKAFDEFKERIANFGDETRREIAIAGELADKIAEANKRERELLVERAKTNVEINKLKTQAAEVDKFTAEQRIFFLEKAAALEDEITAKEVNLAKLRRDIKIEENSLSESTKEDLEAEAQLVANVISLEEQRLIRNKELLGVAAGLRKAEADAKAAERKAEIDAIQKQQDEITGILKGSIIERQEFSIEVNENFNEELKQLQSKKNKEDYESAEQEKILNKSVADAKMQIAVQSFALIGSIAKEGSKVAKLAAIAQATVEGVQGTISAYKTAAASPITSVFPAYPFVQAGIAAGFAAVNIAKIKQQNMGNPSGGLSATPRGGGSAPQAPTFNVVGAAPENQLAQTLGEQEQKPIKAFVVSSEVSNQQALDRNIEQGAALG